MDDLVQWLRAQLDDDERTARAASDGPWGPGVRSGLDVVEGAGWTVCNASDVDVVHIARHDPARVLREIDAKRQIVRQAFEHAATIDGEWGCCHDAEAIEAGFCEEQRPNDLRLLRLLALPYADRAGYREEWRP